MALSFPTSPTAGQQYIAPNGITYTWNSTLSTWTSTGVSGAGGGGGGAVSSVGATAPIASSGGANPVISATLATAAQAAAGTSNVVLSTPEFTVPKDTAGMAGAVLLPKGGNYGGSTSGMFRFNTTSNHVEFYDGTAWQTSVNRSGDTMTGRLNINPVSSGGQALGVFPTAGQTGIFLNGSGAGSGSLTVQVTDPNVGVAIKETAFPAINKAGFVMGSSLDARSGAWVVQSTTQTNYWQALQSGVGQLLLGTSVTIKGNFDFSTGVYTPTSDIKFKENIEPLDPEEYLNLINQLVPCTYDMNGEHSIGFVAQEVEEVLPVLVGEIRVPDKEDPDVEDVTKTMNYMGLTSPLVAAIQALTARLNAVEAELAALKAS